MKSNDPYAARVVSEIGLEDAVAAIEHFAAHYPADRCSLYISERIYAAAITLRHKAMEVPGFGESTQKCIDDNTTFNPYGCVSGRFDSSKENPCFGNARMYDEHVRRVDAADNSENPCR